MKNTLYYLVGILITTSLVRTVYIFQGIIMNYFSGVNPYHLFYHIPIITVFNSLIGMLILILLRILKVKRLTKSIEYFVFGLVLGLSDSGGVLLPWVHYQSIDLLVFILVVGSAIVVAIKLPSSWLAR